MNVNEIKNILIKNLSVKKIYVFSHENHYQIIAVDQMLAKLNQLEQHKIIYAPLMQDILDNKIHSVSIQVFSPEEWELARQFHGV